MPDRSTSAFVLTNPVQEKIAAGQPAFGLNVRLIRTAEIGRIARATGHDFLYLDVQHALFDLQALGQITQTALACGVAPCVRVRSASDPDVPVLLDAGVLGIVVPDVESADQARLIVDRAKYPPIGRRSLAGVTVHHDYRPVPVPVQIEQENAAVLVICMIESVEGYAHLDEIAAVPGVDGIYLGMNDMLASLGKPGRFDDPEIFEILDRVIAASHANGKFVGAGGMTDPAQQVEAIRRGVRYMTTQSDLGLVLSGAQRAIDGIQAGLADQA